MDSKRTMSGFGFGHRESNHIIIDHEGELWLAGAPMAAGGFLRMGGSGLPGALKVEPLAGGGAVPFTYTVTEALLELTTEKGETIKFAIDKEAQAIRISGTTAFRLNSVKDAPGTSGLNLPKGIAVTIGGFRYLFVAKKGKISCDTSWMIHKRHGVAPVVEVEPEDGVCEIYAYDLPDDTDAPVVTKTLEECAAENSAAFEAFVDGLVDVPAQWDDVKREIAHALWLCHRVLDGETEIIVRNKYNSRYTDAKLMAIASMAFKDAKKAVDMMLACPVGLPPVAAVASARLYEDDMLGDSRGEIYRVYAALETVVRKCVKERTVDQEGLAFYAYRYESGEKRSPEFFKVGEPVLAPDLNAYLILAADAMGRLAHLEYDTGAGMKWSVYAKEHMAKLVAELWNGKSFVGKNAYTGEESGADKLLSLVPAILGSRLPKEIAGKLAAEALEYGLEGEIGYLIAGGLYDAGEKEIAEKVALHGLENMRSDGVKCPFCGAALIALAHKVLS